MTRKLEVSTSVVVVVAAAAAVEGSSYVMVQ